MKSNSVLSRRAVVRLALIFAVAQLIAATGVIFTMPALRNRPLETALLAVIVLVDLVLVGVFASWAIRGALSDPMRRLAADVLRIADGDYRHRVGETHRPELRDLRDSVNRLADRLIADQRLLAENIRSLEETNRELIVVRDEMVHSARLASVGTLAAGIAHEVGNPLGAITGFVDLAKKRAERAGGDTDLLDSIRTEANRIDLIVKGLLDYARPRAAGSGPAPVGEVLSGVRTLLESQGKLDMVEVEWDLGDSPDDPVAEPHRLQQVLVNLLLNALDAVADVDGPRIQVRTYATEGEVTRLPPRREDDPPGINYLHRRRRARDEAGVDPVARARRLTVIEVSDNGPGIAEADLEHLFDPFFTTKEPGKGTGLGLSICARLVEGMGGRIDAGASPEGGARFVIRLPGITADEAARVVPTLSGAQEPQ